MSDGPAGRPGQPGKPQRFYFDDLADEEADAAVIEPAATPARPAAPAAPAAPPASPSRPEPPVDEDDDLVDTGPIQVIRDPVLGSAAGQQLYFDDLAPMQHASGPEAAPVADSAEEPDEPEEFGEQPTRGALALAAARRPRPVGAVIAVLAVLALVGVLAAVGGQGHGGDQKRQDSAAVNSATPTGGRPTATGPTTTTATRSAPSTPRSSTPVHRPVTRPIGAPADIPLTVLNNTAIQGLAKLAAQQFSTRGWQVGTVGNYAGQLNLSTVYYDAGDSAERKAAQTFAAQFPGVTQVQPRLAGLPGSGLTVVLAPDWHAAAAGR